MKSRQDRIMTLAPARVHCKRRQANLQSHRPDTVAAREAAVEKVINHIRCNLTDSSWDADLSLDALCRQGGYSKSHFISVFEEVTGTTPHHFLASLRMQRAKDLLLSTNRSVTEISLEIGYNSFPTFSRTFSAIVGLAPSEFRKSLTTVAVGQVPASESAFTGGNLRHTHSP
jgi:AraC-like DNA-binding protein